jgi:peptide/nickel transport system ATP-binding protein
LKNNKHHLVEVRNLSVDFHTRHGIVHAVRNVNWHIERGETLAILGESGSGKSVSASAIMGLIDTPPGHIASGQVLYNGEDLLMASAERRRGINGRNIAMVFQDTLAALNPVYPIGWQVAETFRAHGVVDADGKRKAIGLLERVGLPEAARRFSDFPHQFSGGQRQRIMIAMAIAMQPDLLIADEPTSALDVTVQSRILKLLKELQKETGMGLLLITHDLSIVGDMADRIAVMNNGQIVETGSVQQVFHQPQHAYTRQLLNALPGRAGYSRPEPQAEGALPLLEVRGLSKQYDAPNSLFRRAAKPLAPALTDASFYLKRGETLGIVGESGSGKSTLARTLLGLETPTAGTVHYRGKDMLGLAGREFAKSRRGMQVVFQDPAASLNPRMTVEEIISEPWAIHPDVLARDEWSKQVKVLLAQVGLDSGHAIRYPHQFSGGQRQRIAIARALALRPEIIICDEAVSALDVSVQAQVIALLKRLKTEYGLSYIFIAHDLPVVRDFADRLLVMSKGVIVEQGLTKDLFENPSHPYTKELLGAYPVIDIPMSC